MQEKHPQARPYIERQIDLLSRMLYLQSLHFSHDLLIGKEEATLAILICMRENCALSPTLTDNTLRAYLRSEMSPLSMPVLIDGKIEVTSCLLLQFDMAPHAAKADSHTFIGGWREV